MPGSPGKVRVRGQILRIAISIRTQRRVAKVFSLKTRKFLIKNLAVQKEIRGEKIETRNLLLFKNLKLLQKNLYLLAVALVCPGSIGVVGGLGVYPGGLC